MMAAQSAARLHWIPILVYRGDHVNIETPLPGVTLVAVDVDGAHPPSPTARTVVVSFPHGDDIPLVSAPDAFNTWHSLTIAKGPRFPAAPRLLAIATRWESSLGVELDDVSGALDEPDRVIALAYVADLVDDLVSAEGGVLAGGDSAAVSVEDSLGDGNHVGSFRCGVAHTISV
mgnify:CR=1 FL=1